jgi:iron(III) transport system permease protein
VVRATGGSWALNEATLLLVGRSLGLALACAAGAAIVATLFALITTSSDVRGRRYLHVLAVAPLAIPSYVAASAWIAALAPRGPVGALLEDPPEVRGFFWAALVVGSATYPLAYLPIRAALQRMDAGPYEAARTLGRGPVSAFAHGVLPGLRPAIALGSGLVALYALSEFGAVSLLGYDAFPRVIFLQYKAAFDRSQAAVSSLQLAALIGLALLVTERLQRERSASAPRGRQLHLHFRPAARVYSHVFAVAVSAVCLGVPLVALLAWLVRHPWTDLDWIPGALITSLLVGAAAALCAVVLGIGPALLVERYPSRASRALTRALDYGFALPGVVVALGLGFFALQLATPLYQTWAMLIVAYVALFLALAIAPLRAVLARTPATYEEAARTLGATPGQAFLRVTLPLLRPALIAGALVVWLTALKELPATLLLIPAGEATLATKLWGYTDEALFSEAALCALILVVVSALIVFGVSRRDRA